MRKLCLIMLGYMLIASVWADDCLEPLLDQVTLQLHAEQWVTTKTALLSVGVSAAVNDQGIEKIQNEVLDKLNKLSNKGEWHIVSFDRQLDKSGLESIQILAQARLPQTELGNLRDKAKAISKPGETFTIDNVQFTPSEEEARQANIALRQDLYQQAKAEIDTLNKVYPEQKYYLHKMDFQALPPVVPIPVMMNRVFAAAPQNDKAGGAAPAPLSVGNKVELQAMVVVASIPELVRQKLSHS